MRTIDADALKELFSEVIGHIAKKPEMNGNLEHMIRASAMVIQMIDDAPTVQPDTTTHDSIPAKKGGNDEDRTSGDCISRQQAIDALNMQAEEMSHWSERYQEQRRGVLTAVNIVADCPSAQPDIIRCKDCKWYGRADKRRFYRGMDCLQKRIDTIVPDRDFCSRAERKKNGQ